MDDTTNTFQGSPQQDEQWLREPHGPTGRVQAAVGIDGPLDASALAHGLRQVVQRHESLRTTFAQAGFRIPLQVVQNELEPDWELLAAPHGNAREQLGRILADERERPMDLQHGPLVRGLLVNLSPDRHLLVLTVSSLCADTASMPVLVAELIHHWGGKSAVAEDPLQYADFAEWQRELSESDDEAARAARQIWTAVDGAGAPQLAFRHESTAPFTGHEVAVDLDPSATPAVVHAAWHALLSRLTGERHIVVSFVSPDRRHSDLDGAIGAFARAVPVETTIEGAAPFAAVLDDLERARAGTPEWQDYAPGQTPSALTVGISEYDRYRGESGRLSVSIERIVDTGHNWRLWLSCARGDDPPAAWIHFDPQSYQSDSIERLGRELGCLIRDAVRDPSTRIDALALLDDAERDQVVHSFNDTAAPLPDRHIHELFAARAAATPARDAVIDARGTITYGDLDARANQLAYRLRGAGVGPEVAVGLCTDRSIEMVIGVLGILKAGGAYVPLNPEHPAARLGHQLTSAGARLIVTQEALLSRLPAWDGEVICLDRDRAAIDAAPVSTPPPRPSAENLAYVIYTSGSTGAPKGVAVTHGSLANYVSDITGRVGADREPLRFGMVTSIATDLGNTSLFGALASGGTLVLVSPAVSADAAALARTFEDTPVDVLKITPSHIGALLAGGDAAVLPRRTLVIGGERAPWDLVERVRTLGSCEIVNHYGPTEATIGCCTFAVPDDPGPLRPATVPIGRPIANMSCYVLDDHLEPAPIGTPGTLFVSGAGVARGYVGDIELTRRLFPADPFASSPGARMYATGDVVRWLPDGTLEFLGRADEQIKIRGYRVEPAEVEAALRSHPHVADSVVVPVEGPAAERRLVAYCTAAGQIREDALRTHVAGLLPDFMVPTAIVILDAMPRTASGKVDRQSLPDPELVSESAGPEYVAPRTPIEELIAAVWSDTLGVPRIGINDDFFDLGGHSLLATQVVAQIRSELAVELPLHSLFTCPTVELLGAEIVQLMGASEESETANLLAELEGLSDEEAERLLAGGTAQPDGGAR